MRSRSLVLVALLAVPVLAAGQYDPNAPQPPPPPPPPPTAPPPPPPGPPPRAYPPVPHETGLTLSLRVGYGIPFGSISNEGDPHLDDLLNYKIPFQLDLGYRFNPVVWGNLFVELAPMSVNRDFCLAGHSCGAFSTRFGADLQFHLAPYHHVDPWLGIGIGGEFIWVDAFDRAIGRISTFGYNGFEFPLLEGGLDLAVAPRFTLGPFISYSISEFSGFSVSSPGFPDVSGGIHARTTHYWLEIGLKGTFKL